MYWFIAINQERSQYTYVIIFWNLKSTTRLPSWCHRNNLFIFPVHSWHAVESIFQWDDPWKQVKDLKTFCWKSLPEWWGTNPAPPASLLSSTPIWEDWNEANFPYTLKHLKEPQWRVDLSIVFSYKLIGS